MKMWMLKLVIMGPLSEFFSKIKLIALHLATSQVSLKEGYFRFFISFK